MSDESTITRRDALLAAGTLGAVGVGALGVAGAIGLASEDEPTGDPELVAPFRSGGIPVDDPGSDAWDDAPEAVIPLQAQTLVPPRLPFAGIAELRARALHDGKTVAFRLQWDDEVVDDLDAVYRFHDAVAVMLPMIPGAPPAITMGAKGRTDAHPPVARDLGARPHREDGRRPGLPERRARRHARRRPPARDGGALLGRPRGRQPALAGDPYDPDRADRRGGLRHDNASRPQRRRRPRRERRVELDRRARVPGPSGRASEHRSRRARPGVSPSRCGSGTRRTEVGESTTRTGSSSAWRHAHECRRRRVGARNRRRRAVAVALAVPRDVRLSTSSRRSTLSQSRWPNVPTHRPGSTRCVRRSPTLPGDDRRRTGAPLRRQGRGGAVRRQLRGRPVPPGPPDIGHRRVLPRIRRRGSRPRARPARSCRLRARVPRLPRSPPARSADAGHQDEHDLCLEVEDAFLREHAGRWLPTFFRQSRRPLPTRSTSLSAGSARRLVEDELTRRGIDAEPSARGRAASRSRRIHSSVPPSTSRSRRSCRESTVEAGTRPSR